MIAFHEKHPDVSLLMNVTRHPYSFVGDNPKMGLGRPEGEEKTWHDGILWNAGGNEAKCREAERGMRALGRELGIELDYTVKTNWQPIDSQRTILWAMQFGKAEAYMSRLAPKHFEECKSASHRATILDAAEEAGLDRQALRAFLETDELKAEVWKSYGSTINEKGIHAIPFFCFNSPLTDGGPFRNGTGTPLIVKGSANKDHFLAVFEKLYRDVERANKGGGNKGGGCVFT